MNAVPPRQSENERLAERVFQDACELKELAYLFATASCSAGMTERLNSSVPNLAGLLQGVVGSQLVMVVGRLADRPETGKSNNASLGRLAQLRPSSDDRIGKFQELAEQIREARHKFCAHRDMDAERANAGSINLYLELADLACDIVADFCLDVQGHEALFSHPMAAADFAQLCQTLGVPCSVPDGPISTEVQPV
jgi:hypothetical protein